MRLVNRSSRACCREISSLILVTEENNKIQLFKSLKQFEDLFLQISVTVLPITNSLQAFMIAHETELPRKSVFKALQGLTCQNKAPVCVSPSSR